MDHSPSEDWRSGVEGAISKLETGMTDIVRMLKEMAPQTHQQDSVAVRPPSEPAREPKLTPPELFSGDPDQCRPFLTQCEIHFQLQPSCFPSERSKVAYMISLLSGKAKRWGTAEWQRDSPCCYVFQTFARELCRVFDPVLPEREAARRLFAITQGKRRVPEYIIDFHSVASGSHWNEEALTDAFYRGLNDDIKDGLSLKRYPDSLQGLEDLATRVDLRLAERTRERGPRSSPITRLVGEDQRLFHSPNQPSRPARPTTEEPMQLGRSRLSPAERERRRMGNLCFYCGGAGHIATSCPVKGTAQ